MVEEIMDKTLGGPKGKSYRESGKIPHRPCPVTGKDDVDHREWGVPKEFQAWVETDENNLSFTAEAKMDEDDLSAFNDFMNPKKLDADNP
jgi:hypothetical protein